jgi:hypothetical protein
MGSKQLFEFHLERVKILYPNKGNLWSKLI